MNCGSTGNPHPSGADFFFSLFLPIFSTAVKVCLYLVFWIAKQQDSLQITYASRALDVVFRLIALPKKQFNNSQFLQLTVYSFYIFKAVYLHIVHLLAWYIFVISTFKLTKEYCFDLSAAHEHPSLNLQDESSGDCEYLRQIL